MTESDYLVYFTQCGSFVEPEANYCGVCGTSVDKEQSVVSVDRCTLGDQQW